MGICKKIKNAIYGVDTDWKDEVLSKNILKYGYYGISFDEATGEILAGSSVDVGGAILEITSNISTSMNDGDYLYIDSDSNITTSTDEPIYEYEWKGYYLNKKRAILNLHNSKYYYLTDINKNDWAIDKALREYKEDLVSATDSHYEGEIDSTRWRYQPNIYTFGASVGMDWKTSHTAIVGTPSDDSNHGTVRVYNKSGVNSWSQAAILKLPYVSDSDRDKNGQVSSIDGDYILSSNPFAQINSRTNVGVVKVWKRTGSTWGSTATVLPNPAAGINAGESSRFGLSAIIKDGYVFAGWTDNNAYVKKIAIFKVTPGTNSWNYIGSIASPCNNSSSVFGSVYTNRNMDYNNGRLYVGMPNAVCNTNVASSGQIAVYENDNDTFTLDHFIYAPNAAIYDNFAIGLWTSDNYLYVGSPGDYFHNKNGFIQIYRLNDDGSETHLQTINRPSADSETSTGFATGIAGTDKYLWVGDDTYKHDGTNSNGVVYLYKNNNETWSLVASKLPVLASEYQGFGGWICCDKYSNAIISEFATANNHGPVTIYNLPEIYIEDNND